MLIFGNLAEHMTVFGDSKNSKVSLLASVFVATKRTRSVKVTLKVSVVFSEVAVKNKDCFLLEQALLEGDYGNLFEVLEG